LPALQAVDVDPPRPLRPPSARLPFAGAAVAAVRAAAIASIGSEWLLPKAQGGIRFGRVAKDLHGFSVDAVLMDVPGPKHRHPNGELDLCFATGASRSSTATHRVGSSMARARCTCRRCAAARC
jgi:hypothetical protein